MQRHWYLQFLLACFLDTTLAQNPGLSGFSGNKTEYGPIIIVQPQDAVYDPGTSITQVVMNCKADASPAASYVWYVEQSGNRRLVDLNDRNITAAINGSLTIYRPSEVKHAGLYQCVASNYFGSVLSNEALLSLAFLNDFPKSRRDPVTARARTGVGIECLPPKSGGYGYVFSYSWYKDSTNNPVPSDIQGNIFSSNDGKLYFQFVTVDDQGDYYCVVRRPGMADDAQVGKISMPIPLRVVESSYLAGESLPDPVIFNTFPKAFPSNPKAGDKVRIECIAFRSSDDPMEYSWSRTDGEPMPSNANFSDYNRVLTIPDIQLSDAGRYRCSVSSPFHNSSFSELSLDVQAIPYFTKPLTNVNVELNSTLNWKCMASGVPNITYAWYVNATSLDPASMAPEDRDRFRLVGNVLTITDVQPSDSGMYQCAAMNELGRRMSSGQLSVVSCAPNCTTNGCVVSGAGHCDFCELGFDLTPGNTCSPPVLNSSLRNVVDWRGHWTLLMFLLWSSIQ